MITFLFESVSTETKGTQETEDTPKSMLVHLPGAKVWVNNKRVSPRNVENFCLTGSQYQKISEGALSIFSETCSVSGSFWRCPFVTGKKFKEP